MGKASVERGIRDSLFWPDGSKKMSVKSEPVDESRCWMLQLVQALVDKYNEDLNLFKVCSLSLLHVLTLYHATSWSASCYTTVLFVHLTTSR